MFWCRISYLLLDQIVLLFSDSVQGADGTFVLCHKTAWTHHKETLGKKHGKVLLQMAQLSITTGDAQTQFAMIVFSGLC